MALQIDSKTPQQSSQFLEISKKSYNSFLARKDIGFPNLPERSSLWESAGQLGSQLRTRYETMVVVGIGGSALGPRVLADLFASPQGTHDLKFCDNVDPWEFERLFQSLKNIEKTCWVFVSKSGSTIETLTALDFVWQRLGAKVLTRAVVISEPRSNPLMDWAKQNSLPCLEIPLDVGGRFSVLSSVGLLPAAFLGVDLEEMRLGAQEALQSPQSVHAMMANALASFSREEWISQFWFYSSGLKNFGGWLQQLWAESLGKKQDRQGKPARRASTPLSQVGACDQHSVLQQVMEGAKDKWVVFTRVSALEGSGEVLKNSLFPIQDFLKGKKMGQLLGAEAAATQMALHGEGVSTLTLTVTDLSPRSIGELFMFWQLVVAGLGECLDIDAFNQPGVEVGKKLAKESLKR